MSVNDARPSCSSDDVFAGCNQSLSLNSWRADAVVRGRRLRFLMDVAVAAEPGNAERLCASTTLNCYLAAVRDAVANEKPIRRVRSALFGSRIDAAEINLNAGEALVARYTGDEEIKAHLPRLLSQVERCFPPHDPRRVEAVRGLVPLHTPPASAIGAGRRRLYMQTLRSVNEVAQQQLTRVRSFRNKVGLWTFILLVIAVVLGLIGAKWPSAVQTCFHPQPAPGQLPEVPCPAGQGRPTGGDISLVLVLGVLGAALSVAVGLRSARQTSSPYGVAGVLLLMKLPCGALTALAGLLLIRGGFVPGFSAIDTQEQIIAYAVLFGFAQQLITRLVDDKGREVLDKVQSSEPPDPHHNDAKVSEFLHDGVAVRS